MKLAFSVYISFFLFLSGCANNDADGDNGSTQATTPTLTYSIVATYPHDTSSYTQGLAFYNGELLEGTGNYGNSKLRLVDLQSGGAKREVSLADDFFGEGITVLNDTIYQLTWKEGKVFVYSPKDFKKIKEFEIKTQGWGITNNGENLIVTDGSNNLYFYDPSTFRLLRTQGVTENGTPSVNLNELEYINGYIYSNQYLYPYILKIDPNSGQVVARIDLTDLAARVKATYPKADVLNGIAYNAETDKIYVTGKNWPQLFEIQFPH